VIYNYFGFLIANAMLVVIKCYESNIKSNIYQKAKNTSCLNKPLDKLEKYNYQLQLKLFGFLINFLQKNVIPLISNMEQSKSIPEVIQVPYSSKVFNNKEEEVAFLSKLEAFIK
tara:strand:- start:288 stop:629 length:342 start_codon:yes stop_codon:yes gene_type:complete